MVYAVLLTANAKAALILFRQQPSTSLEFRQQALNLTLFDMQYTLHIHQFMTQYSGLIVTHKADI